MNKDDKDYLDLAFKGMKADIKADLNMVGYKVDELIEYQKIQNGRIGKLEKETRIFRLIHRNPKISGAIIILIIIGGLTMWPLILKAIF